LAALPPARKCGGNRLPLRRNVAEYRSNSIPRLVNGLERLQAIHLSPHVCTKFRVLVEFETL
jgi:hypothetical protein